MGIVERERIRYVEVIRLADPPLNLLGSDMIEALRESFTSIAAHPPRAVVLHCSGAGANVREMAGFDERRARRFITALHTACRSIRDLDAPVIAAVGGVCLGAHLEVAAACDLRVGTTSSRYGMPEVKVGIPSVIDAWWLSQICGLGRACELVFDGEMIDATEAHRIGLLNRVVGDDGLDEETMAWAKRIAKHSPAALVQQKRVLRDWTQAAYEEAAKASIERLAHAFRSKHTSEAMRAMLDKRRARF
jgi:enoyl-CoA hydratase/carnithine racemase